MPVVVVPVQARIVERSDVVPWLATDASDQRVRLFANREELDRGFVNTSEASRSEVISGKEHHVGTGVVVVEGAADYFMSERCRTRGAASIAQCVVQTLLYREQPRPMSRRQRSLGVFQNDDGTDDRRGHGGMLAASELARYNPTPR